MDSHQPLLAPVSARQPRGMTLLECMVSLALVAGVIVLVFVSLGNQGRVASEQFVEVDLQTQLRRGNDEIFNVLADAHLIALSDDARWVDFNYPKQAIDATTLKPVPGALSLSIDGTVVYGIFDPTTSPPTWIDNGFFHLETVDDTSETVTVNPSDWYIDQSSGGNTLPLTFVPVRFEMTSYRRSAADLKTFNSGIAANEADRMSKGYPRLVKSAILDYSQGNPAHSYAEPDPSGLGSAESGGPFKMYTRTLTLRCFRDSTPRLPAPYDRGEGVFYMRRKSAISPIQKANAYTDSNGNGEYDDGEPVSPDIYGAASPLVYHGQYCPADTDDFNEESPASLTNNNVCDGSESPSMAVFNRYYQSMRIVLYAVHSGNTGGLTRGIQGIKRVLSSQTSIRLRNGNLYR